MTDGNRKFGKSQKVIIAILAAIIALVILPFLSWLITDESLTATSDAKFCVSCHTMAPFEAAHNADVHGGKNAHGVRATCADCHLPHDNSFNYIYTKGRTGLHDLYVENFGDLESIDWQAKRLHRESYTYDSGCLTCHTNLEEATMSSNDALIAHRAYFQGQTDDKCVTCHENVGHHNISDYIAGN